MSKDLMVYVTIAIIALSFIPAQGQRQQDCCSSITISVQSNEPIDLKGFSVKLDNYQLGLTDPSGYICVPAKGLAPGKHKIEASKTELDGTAYKGGATKTIPCINESSGRECYWIVDVKAQSGETNPPNPYWPF